MIALLIGCGSVPEFTGVHPTPGTSDDTETASPEDTAPSLGVHPLPGLGGQGERYRFAVLGDYGTGDKDAAAVGALVARMDPAFVITVGDNNYPDGEAETIDANVGQFYHAFIGNYQGKYGEGSEENRFWPCPGNHDWDNIDGMLPYTEYFTLPGNERYYDFRYEDIHFFCVDSDPREPDGTTITSPQAAWLKAAMLGSDAPRKIVYMHHPPYSSGSHGDSVWMQWPLVSWGADMVLSGHDHSYERQVHDGVPFIVTGLGGYRTYSLRTPSPHSQMGFTEQHGATLVRVYDNAMVVETWSVDDGIIDRFRLKNDTPLSAHQRLISTNSEWSYTTDDPGEGWSVLGFDDSAWPVGAAPLGDNAGTAIESTRVWARQVFSLSAPQRVRRLSLELDAEGATEVFLNGTLLIGPVQGALSVLELPVELLAEGDNVLSVASSVSAGPARFSASLIALSGQPLIEMGAQWQVTDAAPRQDWAMPGFDDSAWSTLTAPAVFPWALDDSGMPASPTTLWLRHTFEGADDLSDLLLSLSRSDGAVVYLNGREVHRSNVPSDAFGPALWGLDSDWTQLTLTTLIEPGLLREGDNVVAAAVSTASTDTTGLWFDLGLTGL